MRIDGDGDEGLQAAVGTARRGSTTIELSRSVERAGDLGSDGQIGLDEVLKVGEGSSFGRVVGRRWTQCRRSRHCDAVGGGVAGGRAEGRRTV